MWSLRRLEVGGQCTCVCAYVCQVQRLSMHLTTSLYPFSTHELQNMQHVRSGVVWWCGGGACLHVWVGGKGWVGGWEGGREVSCVGKGPQERRHCKVCLVLLLPHMNLAPLLCSHGTSACPALSLCFARRVSVVWSWPGIAC